ncbi:MAG: response regulator transcription factor [Lachnospiraceae bacterium]|nr:response regulator transcription factor [Lachnospiraceae bacterium]
MFKILVVEDDNELNRLFCRTLERNGYEALAAADASEALEILDKESVDVIISDVMMPGMDGFEFVRQLREAQMTLPIMMITAKSDIKDKQSGFLSGADDYMVKPVELQEMLLRVQALLRRAKSVSERKLSFGGTSLLYDVWTVEDGQGSQILPQKEFQLLYKLLSYPGQIFTRQQILDDIWGPEGYVDSHTLDVHISRLRERFKKNEDFEIVTIRGLGYRAVKKNG